MDGSKVTRVGCEGRDDLHASTVDGLRAPSPIHGSELVDVNLDLSSFYSAVPWPDHPVSRHG